MVLWYPCLHSRNRSVGKPSLFFLYCTLYTATILSIIYMPPPCGCYTVEPFWVLVISRMVCNLNSLSVPSDYVVSQKCSNTPSTGFLLMFPVMTLFLLFGFGFQTIHLCGAWLKPLCEGEMPLSSICHQLAVRRETEYHTVYVNL